MSQPELLRELREARPVAPAEVRERVRLLAALAPSPPARRLTLRRALLVAVPVVAAAVIAAVVVPRGHKAATPGPEVAAPKAATSHLSIGADRAAPATPVPSRARLQRYSASLSLRLRNAGAVSDASQQAIAIARALGGYPRSVDVSAAGHTGAATLVLKVPKLRVQEAIRRLSALGTVIAENVSVQDLQAQADATDRLITRLQRRLAGWRAIEPQTAETQRQVEQLTARIERLQRRQAATARSAHYATVSLTLTSREPAAAPQESSGPLHGLGVAFRWLGIGALYALALGAPVVLVVLLCVLGVRTARRRSEDRLLSRP